MSGTIPVWGSCLSSLASQKPIRGEFHHSDAHFESVAYATTLCSFQRWKNPKCPWPESITFFEQLSEAVREPSVGADCQDANSQAATGLTAVTPAVGRRVQEDCAEFEDDRGRSCLTNKQRNQNKYQLEMLLPRSVPSRCSRSRFHIHIETQRG